jgi:hypothetical protein
MWTAAINMLFYDIWAGIFNNNIIGPFEIEENSNSATY